MAELENLVFVSLEGTEVTEAGLESLRTMRRLKTVLYGGG